MGGRDRATGGSYASIHCPKSGASQQAGAPGRLVGFPEAVAAPRLLLACSAVPERAPRAGLGSSPDSETAGGAAPSFGKSGWLAPAWWSNSVSRPCTRRHAADRRVETVVVASAGPLDAGELRLAGAARGLGHRTAVGIGSRFHWGGDARTSQRSGVAETGVRAATRTPCSSRHGDTSRAPARTAVNPIS